MKILHLISQYPAKTGSGVYLSQVYKNLKLKGYNQKVLCAMNSDDIVETEFDDIEIIKFNGGDFEFPVVGMSDIMPYKSTLFSDLKGDKLDKYIQVFKDKINDIVKRYNPDIIFSNHLYIMTSILSDMKLNCKVIAFCHGTCLRQLSNNFFHRDIIINGIRNVDKIFALSELQKDEISDVFSFPKKDIKVIGGGFDSDFYFRKEKKKFDDNSLIKIIYAGKFSRAKGVIYLLKAFEKIREQYNIKLILAGGGTGAEYDEIVQYADKLSNYVELKGYMSTSEIGDLFRSCDIFAMPSFYEGLSLVTIEAIACGLNVVTNELDNLLNFIGPEIYESNIFEIVSMPDLYDKDKINPNYVDIHVKNWEKSLLKQIRYMYTNSDDSIIFDMINKFS